MPSLYDDQVGVQAQVAGIEGGANAQWEDQSDPNDIYGPVNLVRAYISRRSTACIRQGSLDCLIHRQGSANSPGGLERGLANLCPHLRHNLVVFPAF